MDNNNRFSINFDYSVNHIVRFKNGETLYFLDKLILVDNEPVLHFKHALCDKVYNTKFTDKLFSGKFVFVNWDDLSILTKKKILNQHSSIALSSQIDTQQRHLPYNPLYNNVRMDLNIIDDRIRFLLDKKASGDYIKIKGNKQIADGIDGINRLSNFFSEKINMKDLRIQPPDKSFSYNVIPHLVNNNMSDDAIDAVMLSTLKKYNTEGVVIRNPHISNVLLSEQMSGTTYWDNSRKISNKKTIVLKTKRKSTRMIRYQKITPKILK